MIFPFSGRVLNNFLYIFLFFFAGCGYSIYDSNFLLDYTLLDNLIQNGGALPCSGCLDTSFNSIGSVVYTNALSEARAVAIDSSDRIVAAGYIHNGANTDLAIWRYNVDGTPDISFGSGGIVTHNSAAGGDWDDAGNAIALDSSGRIVVVGYSMSLTGGSDLAVWRYNVDGTPDTSFGTGGIVTHNGAAGGNGDDGGYAVVIDSNGKIIVIGSSTNPTWNSDMTVWRYNTDGTPDMTFDLDGILTNNGAAGGSADFGKAAAVALNDGIIVGGYSYNAAGNSDMAIWNYDATGSPVTTFDADGIVTSDKAAGGSPYGNSIDTAYAILIDSQDRIVSAGYSSNPSSGYDATIWRYNADGTPDLTFDSDGIVLIGNGDVSANSVWAMMNDSAGRILVTGLDNYGGGIPVWRYNADGTPDTTFGSDGIATQTNVPDRCLAIDMDSAGRIVLVGFTFSSGNMAIWRIIP